VAGNCSLTASAETSDLEILGDAAGERPFPYVPLFWARTCFPDATEEARRTLARSTLIRLQGIRDSLYRQPDVP
jgi:hypothetical protein